MTSFAINGAQGCSESVTHHVESYFFKATSPDAKRAFWLKATIFKDGTKARAEGWAIAFDHRQSPAQHAAVKHEVPLSDAHFGKHDLSIRWAANNDEHFEVDGLRLRGNIKRHDHELSWDLCLTPQGEPFFTLPVRRLYTSRFPSSKSVTPYPSGLFEGSFRVNGEVWRIDGWKGMQGHNWGKHHASHYAWCHCNQWESDEDLVIEAVSARIDVARFKPLFTVIHVRYRGQDFAFDRPQHLLGSQADLDLRRYSFVAKSKRATLRGQVEADTSDLVGLTYNNPVRPVTFCLNSKLARMRLRLEVKGEEAIELTSHAAALEIGTHTTDHGVRMVL